ncbi:hypothetical protein [Roseomonas sp. BN140053]|uniref:hypothetical protein n=1 Tax=Roseomonas sp. BN140053 TaxID=3391898 RepID=UPI0039EAC804
MTTNVFVAGHGRMRLKGEERDIPAGVTLSWAVAPGYNSQLGVSTALIKGEAAQWAETKTTGEKYREHYLCPDSSVIMSMKGEAMMGRADKAGCYLLQPRSDFATSLTSLIAFLQQEFGGSFHLYWTCCRTPINQPSLGAFTYSKATRQITPTNKTGRSAVSPKNDPQVGKDKVIKVQTIDGVTCINNVRGAVTLLRGNAAGLKLTQTWPDNTVLKGDAGDVAGRD